MRKLLLLVSIIYSFQTANAQLVISSGGTPASIVSGFVGAGLVISNPSISCPANAYGTFSGGAGTSVGISNGIIMTTGTANLAVGPNNSSSDGFCNGTSLSDPQLISLDPQATEDVCIVEFDIVPQCNQLTIRFVFGSEEYPEFVSSGFNDAFGFFISGPNPSGGTYNNYNVARLTPGGTQVSIDNVNATTNAAYYVNNAGGTSIEYDGLTTQITSTLNLTPCATYHFKLAIADAGDCSYDSGVFVDFLACTNPLVITPSSTPASCAGATGTATVTASGGIPPYSYAWSTGATTSSISSLAAGTYSVTVNDAITCTPAQTFTITVGSTGTASTVTVPPTNTYCPGATVPASSYTSTPAGGTFTWTNSNTAIGLAASGTGNQPSFTATNTGTTPISGTITVTPTVASCPGTPSSYTITVNPTPNVVDPANITVCSGAAVPASAFSGSVAGTTFNWTNSNTAIGLAASGAGNTPAFTATNTGSTPITSTITVTPTAAGCTGPAQTYTITVNPLPTVTVPVSPTVCAGALVAASTFTSTPAGATFTWTNSNTAIGLAASGTGNQPSFTAANTGTANISGTITVTPSLAGCTGTPSTYTITVRPIPNVVVPANITVCNGANVPASAFTSSVGGATFAWSNSNTAIGLAASGTGNTPAFTATNTGSAPITSTVTVTPSAAGCTGTPASYTITVNPTPVVAVPANITICAGASVSASNFTSTPTGGTFAWTNSNTAIGLAASGTGNQPSFTATNSSTASISSTITVTPTVAGCPGTPSTYTITVLPVPNVVVPANITVCNGGSVAASAFTSSVGTTTFAWTNSNTAIGLAASGSGNTPGFTAVNTGTAPVTATITVTPTAGGCPGPAQTYTITVNPSPNVVVPANITVCNGGAVAASAFTSSTGGTTFTWTNSNATIGLAASGSGNTPGFTAVNTGTTAVTATITVTPTANGCTGAVSTYTITVNPSPVVTVNSPSICPGGTATLTAAGATGFSWSTGATTSSISVSPASTTSYTVTGTTSGCTGTAIATVTVGASMVVTVNSPTICAGQSATLTASGGTTYTWSTGGTTNPITVSPAATTSYTVTGTTGTCAGTAIATVTVNPVPTVNTVAPVTVCNGSTAPSVTLSSTPAGSTFSWTNSNTSIGLAATGTGNPPSFTAVNTGGTAVTATITVTPQLAGCTGPASTYTITVNPSPTVTVPAPITICAGATVAASTFTSSPAGGTFSWTNSNPAIGLAASGTGSQPSFTAVNTGSAAITATITVTPTVAGCVGAPSTYTITVNPTPNVVVPANITVCPGDLIVGTNFTSAASGTTYSWTNSNTAIGLAASGSGQISGFAATNSTAAPITATITVTPQASGCTGPAQTYTITVNPTPTVTVPANIVICNGGAVAASTFTSNPAGGTFSWTNSNPSIGLAANGTGSQPAFTAVNTGSAPVTATITVTPTVAGCVGTPSTYTITVEPTPAAPTAAGVSICANMTATLTATAPGGSYEWFDAPSGGTLLATGASFTTPNLNANTTYYVQTTSAAGCVSPMTPVTVTIASGLTVNAGLNDTICYGANTALTVIPNGAGYTYSWSPATGLSSTTVYNPTASPTITTTYTVTVTDGGGCTGTDQVMVYVDPQLTLAIAGIAATCNGECDGQTIVIPGGGTTPYSYSWSSGCTSAACNSQCAGSYTVTVTDALGCSADTSTTVAEPSAITLTTSATTATCNQPDGSATVTASGGTPGYTYLWPDGQTSATAINLVPGVYCVQVTDANGCSDTACVTVPNASGVEASIASQTATTCNGVCDGTATAAAIGGTAPYLVSWSTIPVQTTMTATGLCAGTYTVTITDATGCADNATVTITQPSVVVTAPISNVTICNSGTATLTASASGGSGAPYSYTWTPAGTGSTATVSVSPAVTTVYTVTSADNAGCQAVPVAVTVTVNPPLDVTMSAPAATCPGGTVTIGATGSYGNGGPYNYSWSPAVSGSGSSVSVSPSATTTYTVTVTDGCSPAVTDSVTVTINPLPVVSFSSNVTSGCAPLCVNFSDATTVSGGSVASWSWNFGDGSSADLTQNPVHCFATPGQYTISLTTVSASGCSSSSTINNMITVYPVPVASFSAPLSASILSPIVPFTDNSTDAVQWEWDFGDSLNPTTNTSNSQNPTHVYSEVGTYCITLIVTSAGGCEDTTVMCLVVDPEFTFYIPNAFSPNGDGTNDEFFGKGEHIKQFEMFIFDRWGNNIFYTDDIDKHWDGKANHGSEIAQQDVYVYKVNLTDNQDRKHNYIGTVTIIK